MSNLKNVKQYSNSNETCFFKQVCQNEYVRKDWNEVLNYGLSLIFKWLITYIKDAVTSLALNKWIPSWNIWLILHHWPAWRMSLKVQALPTRPFLNVSLKYMFIKFWDLIWIVVLTNLSRPRLHSSIELASYIL